MCAGDSDIDVFGPNIQKPEDVTVQRYQHGYGYKYDPPYFSKLKSVFVPPQPVEFGLLWRYVIKGALFRPRVKGATLPASTAHPSSIA